MSAFDDLLDLDGPSETQKVSNPFDPFGSEQSTSQTAGISGGDLLGLEIDAQISTENDSSGKVNFEANTNPLYEFTNSESKMSSDSANPLYDEISNDPAQKEAKSEPTNLLYEFMQNEGTTNGHNEEELTNGHTQEVDLLEGGGRGDVDLLGDSGNSVGDDLMGDNSGDDRDSDLVYVDSGNNAGEGLMGGDSGNVGGEDLMDGSSVNIGGEDLMEGDSGSFGGEDLMGRGSGDTREENGDLLGNSKPVDTDDLTVQTEETQPLETQPGEAIQTGSRSSSEQSEPEQENEGETSQQQSEVVSTNEERGEVPVIESRRPLKEGPNNSEDETAASNKPDSEALDAMDTAEVLEEGTNDIEADQAGVRDITAATQIETVDKDEEVNLKDEENKQEKEEAVPVDEVIDRVETETVETALATQNVTQGDTEKVDAEEVQPAENVEEIPTEQPEPEVPVKEVEYEVIEETKPAPDPEQISNVEAETTGPVENKERGVVQEESTEVEDVDRQPENLDTKDEDAGVAVVRAEAVSETRNSAPEDNSLKVNGTSETRENGVSEEEAVRDPNIFRETHEKEEVHFAEMNNVRQKFEAGLKDEEQSQQRISVKDEYDEGGEFENQPVQNPDVVKETDQPQEELPEVGMAKNLVNRFKHIQEEKLQVVASQKRPSPPRDGEKVEYESQPTEHLPQYEGQTESGVFESQPKSHEDVIRSGELAEDYKPEQGYAKNILNRFKEIETEKSQYKSHEKRELTPDRSGKVEYVSEPRGEKITYNETQSESGVFENVPKEEEDVIRSGDRADEVMPESGMAKSLLSKFKQMETEAGNKPPPSPKREILERTTRSHSTHEQRGYLESYEPTVESGEFENQPEIKPEVIRSGDLPEEVMPEAGSAKKAMDRFREIQKQSTSPITSKAKEITPPREQSPGRNVAGVFESTPAERGDVIRSGESQPEELPEQGTTRNILNRFKEIQSSGSQSSSPGKKHKEFTPPPESGVYENKPKEHLVIETRQAESGIIESTPKKSEADVAREREATPESDLPEQGIAKNLVSRWKQLESASGSAKSTSSASPRFKEFTPPRDSRGPLSPKSPGGVTNSVHPSDLPGQYQPQESSLIYENKPEVKEGVYREADTDWTEGMPAPNTTASMLQRFKSIQDDAKAAEKTPDPVRIKEKGMFKVVQTEKCAACQKTVYAMEKLEMNGHIYHKNCFKCSHCSARLTAKTFSMNEGVIYCVNHFKQLFARKGNYDEGFGRQQYKKKWQGDKPEGATA